MSVVVAAYNAKAYLRETLASVSAQRYRRLEIIVVDDGSTDSTSEVVEEWSRNDPRIRLIRQANTGVGAARNPAITAANGKYVAPIDADDVWDAEKIFAQVAEMEKCGEAAGFVYCWTRSIDGKGRVIGAQQTCSIEASIEGKIFNALFFRNFLHSASVPLFRMAALRRVGGYATREEQGGVQGCEDWELCLRVASQYEVRVVPQYLVNYRRIGSGMSLNVSCMEGSFHWMIRETVKRMPVSPKLVRWSAGYYYLYLALMARQSGQVETSLRCLAIAAKLDFATFLAPRYFSILAHGCYRRIYRWTPSSASRTPTSGWSWRDAMKRIFWLPYLHIERTRFVTVAGALKR